MVTHRYIFADLLSNNILTELPMRRVRIEQRLNEVGSFIGYAKLSDPNVQKLFPWSQTPGGRTALYVDRDGTLLWGGIVVTRRYSEGPVAPQSIGAFDLEIGASEFFWYFRDKAVIATDQTFTAVEQMTIPGSLISYEQGKGTANNIGVNVPSFPASGVLRTVSWKGVDRKKVGAAIVDIAQLDQGFDWMIRVGYGLGGQPAGTPGKQLALGCPRLGSPYNITGWQFEYPGNIVDYTWAEDSSQQAITAYVQGSGAGASMVQSSNTITSFLDAGYPDLQEVFRAKDQTDPNVIAARAVSAAKTYSQPVALLYLLVRTDLDPVLGSYSVGDDALVRLTSKQFPAPASGGPGYSGYWRILARRIQPQEEAQPERVLLTMGAPPT